MGTAITVLSKLGAGGFGTVYLAEVEQRSGLRQRVALKVLNVALSEVTELVQRQRDEARLLGLLNHPNIVQVHELLEWNGRPAFTMEYVDGSSLSYWIRRHNQSLPLVAALEVLSAVSDALQAASTALGPSGAPLKVIHRDIKPANILLSNSGQVKLLDFGIARAHFDQEHSTRSVQMGTARYMAPEQWLLQQVSSASDVYALGISCIELLRGRFLQRFPLDRMSFELSRADVIESLDCPDELKRLLDLMTSFLPLDRPSAQQTYEQSIELLDATRREGSAVNLHQLSRLIREDSLESLSEESELTPLDVEEPLTGPPLSTPLLLEPIPMLETASLPSEPMTILDQPIAAPGPQNGPNPERWIWPSIAVLATLFAVFFSLSQNQPLQPDPTVVRTTLAAQTSTQLDDSSAAAAPKEIPPPAAVESSVTANQATSEEQPNNSKAQRPGRRAANRNVISVPITISSIPMGAKVYIDGNEVGRTLLVNHPVRAGKHRVELSLNNNEHREHVRITADGPTRFQWKVEADTWHSFSD